MNVKELKEKLANLPDDMPVMVSGYECDYDMALNCGVVWVKFLCECDYSGNYELCSPRDPDAFEAFLIPR